MKDDARPKPDIQTPPMWWRRDRWRYAAGCFLLGAAYTSLAMLYGFELRLGGHDVSLVAGGMLELSFAVLGYLLGVTREARRGERLAAKEVEEQLRNLADLRARLAQTEKLASLGQLSGALAHEVRNPLAIIRSMVQNLSEELPDDADAARGELRRHSRGGGSPGAGDVDPGGFRPSFDPASARGGDGRAGPAGPIAGGFLVARIRGGLGGPWTE